MSEEQLIRRAQQGDNSAFEQLLLAHQKKVYNLCLRMAANPDDALDLSQEAFIKAWRALGQYQFEASFSTWLFRLTSNVCIDFLRQKKRRQETSLTENYDDSDEGAELSLPDCTPLPEQQAITNETKIELARAMGQLAPDHREILQLRVVEDLPYEQIADILGVRVGTVKSRLARARLSLRKILNIRRIYYMPFGDYDSSNNSMDLLGMQANKDMYEDMGANSKNSDREFKKSKTKKKVDVKKIVIVVIIVAACLAAFFARKVYTRNYYTQEYTAGTKEIKGNVNVNKFTDISEDFAIGANSNGYAVFKNPSKAFKTFEKMYADDIQSLKDEFGLKDFNKKTYHDYMTYGWQSNVGTDEEKQNKKFISSFLDIYENSEWR